MAESECMDWSLVDQRRVRCRSLVKSVIKFRVP